MSSYFLDRSYDHSFDQTVPSQYSPPHQEMGDYLYPISPEGAKVVVRPLYEDLGAEAIDEMTESLYVKVQEMDLGHYQSEMTTEDDLDSGEKEAEETASPEPTPPPSPDSPQVPKVEPQWQFPMSGTITCTEDNQTWYRSLGFYWQPETTNDGGQDACSTDDPIEMFEAMCRDDGASSEDTRSSGSPQDEFDPQCLEKFLFDTEEDISQPYLNARYGNTNLMLGHDTVDMSPIWDTGAAPSVPNLGVLLGETNEKPVLVGLDDPNNNTKNNDVSRTPGSRPRTHGRASPSVYDAESVYSSCGSSSVGDEMDDDDNDNDYDPSHGYEPDHNNAIAFAAGKRSRRKSPKLWTFLLDCLCDPRYNPCWIRWENKARGLFKIVETKELSRLWGRRSGKKAKPGPKHDMNYEKFSRAIRYYYKGHVLKSVPGRLTYQFGPNALGWRRRAENDSN